ncbi:nucleotidyl transferase AbiEii/AbiGii toxin family protein [bacterium]|nr:nucleotidyl transferase AbiEii/AbiGii toxin family protein [bacterium]
MICSRQPQILTRDQDAFLNAFFRLTSEFYLTGGTALAGFYLGHRTSIDLDLFTQDADAFEHLDVVLSDTADALGIAVRGIRTTHYFKHFEAEMSSGPLTIHSARDVPARLAPVASCGDTRVDSIEDIMANKLCAMLGRSAMKDFIDLLFLDRAGYDTLSFLPRAQRKDGGMAAESLAYSIEQLSITAVPDFLVKPVTLDELLAFKENTINKLVASILPDATTA